MRSQGFEKRRRRGKEESEEEMDEKEKKKTFVFDAQPLTYKSATLLPLSRSALSLLLGLSHNKQGNMCNITTLGSSTPRFLM